MTQDISLETTHKLNQLKFKWQTLTDELRWKTLPQIQQDIPGLIVNLDNDDTFITHRDNEDFMLFFDNFIGWKDGVQILLKAFNIKAEPV